MTFDYGDVVTVKTRDNGGKIAERKGVVVAFNEIKTKAQAEATNFPIGTVLYTVEFGDGTDSQVSEGDLIAAPK